MEKSSNLKFMVMLIQLLHLLLVLGVISSIFIPNYKVKQLALTLLIFLFIQYITNYGKCGLTELEYLIKGEKYKEGFIYRLIKPIITVREEYFDKYVYIVHILITLLLYYQINK